MKSGTRRGFKASLWILISAIVMFSTTLSLASPTEFEVIRRAADNYLSSGKADLTVSAKELWTILTDGNKQNDPYVVSVRQKNHYMMNHICGARNIPWRAMFMDFWLKKMPPKDKKVVVYSYNGHNAGQVVAFLNMMGWDARNLKWGFTSWILCPESAPGLFRSSTQGGVGRNYRIVKTSSSHDKTYSFPVVENTRSDNKHEIIRAAADAWFRREIPDASNDEGTKTTYKDPDITPKDLFYLLIDSDSGNDPFVLDIRDPELYGVGHIKGAVNIPLNDLVKKGYLKKLQPDRQIAVVCKDGMRGSQVTGILNALGYDAINLLFGMTGWTRNEQVAPGRFEEYHPGTTKHKDILDLETCFGHGVGAYN